MHRTTVYLPDDLKAELGQVAEATGRSEADLIRTGIRQVVRSQANTKPTIPLFRSGDPQLAQRVDEALAGFGES